MTYLPITLLAAGISFDNYLGQNSYGNVLVNSSAITLVGNVVINPSVSIGGASFKVRGTADVTLSTFSVTICGTTINQDQVNQSGTFDCYYDGSAWSVQYFADGTDLPQNAQGYTSVAVPVSGTLTLTAGASTVNQRLVGSPTVLAGNYNVTAGTSGVKAGSEFMIEIGGGVTIGSNTFTVFGVTVSASQALNGGILIYVYFDGAVWRGLGTSKPISAADLNPQAALSVVVNATNASASPSALAFANDGDVLVRAGTALIAQKLSTSNFDTSTFPLKYISYNLSSPEILDSFTTPVEILAAVVGVTHVPVLVVWETTYGSTPYATNTNGIIRPTGGSAQVVQQNGLLAFTASGFAVNQIIGVGAFTQQLVKGAALEFSTLTGNPTAGDSTIKVHLFYIDL
jgi:hypothetical protein